MNLVEIEKIVAGIQQKIFKSSNSYASGILKSSVQGSGLQFKEHRVYNHGDDVRFIDWKLSARSSTETYIKTFEEERNAEIVSVVDLAPSLFIGIDGKTKLQCILEILCLIYLVSKETNDYQRVIFLGEKQIDLPPKNGKEGIILLVATLEKLGILDEKGKVIIDTNLNFVTHGKRTITKLKSYIAKRKELIYFTDFNNFETTDDLSKLLLYRNFHCFKVTSPIEEMKKLPFAMKFKGYVDEKLKYFFSRTNANKVEEDMPKRYRKLNIEDRYLENFIKEMI